MLKSKIFFWLTGFLFLFLLGLYLFQIGQLIQYGYSGSVYKEKISRQEKQNTALTEETARLVSFKGLEEKARSQNFIEVAQVKYLSLPGGSAYQHPLTLNK